ncbi:DUF6234 family protein [Streptomyces sp. NBC_01465]|uniref:DUF6234 family protein n=1 Tax=Streptomyces sp. NBC_01465 TaxID=2903878 RepID=UPI002E33299F|nr:DUF6234 family protein [Streptomyces sp. NBC_01465]
MRPGGRPSTGEQAGVSAALFVLDLMVIAVLWYRWGITAWADGTDPDNPPSAPAEALRGAWILAGGAVVTGGGLLARRWRIPGVMQLMVLGGTAALFASAH